MGSMEQEKKYDTTLKRLAEARKTFPFNDSDDLADRTRRIGYEEALRDHAQPLEEALHKVMEALEDVDKEVALLKEMEDFAVRRGSTRGILVHEDFNALGYQRKHKEWSVLKRKRNELLPASNERSNDKASRTG